MADVIRTLCPVSDGESVAVYWVMMIHKTTNEFKFDLMRDVKAYLNDGYPLPVCSCLSNS